VVVIADYPGASPEIVESEVSRKIEEGVNSIAGISALTSRSYEGQSVVVIEFNLNIDGRKAADDVREKVAVHQTDAAHRGKGAARAALRPVGARRLVGGGICADPATAKARRSAVELTNWAEQTLKKRLRERARRRLGHPGGRHPARNQPVPEPAGAGDALALSPTRW